MAARVDAAVPVRRSLLRRFWPLVVMVAVAAVVMATGLHRELTLEALARHHRDLADLVAAHRVLAAIGFVLIYAAATGLSVPGALVLTVSGGVLFGAFLGTVLVVLGATCGATLVFLIARSAMGEGLRRRAGSWLKRMEAGFQDNALSYMLVLRLVPLFPFFIVNIAPALLGVPLRLYVLTTLVGIVPGSYVYAALGAGVGDVIAAGGTPSLEGALTPQTMAALGGFALLALLPVAYKAWRGGGAGRTGGAG